MVGLRDDRDAAALEALHEIHLPEGAAAVEPARHEPADQLAQLRVGAGPGQRRAADVEGDVEVGVVHPHRAREVSRHRADLLPVARHQADPVLDQRDQAVVVEALLGRLEDREAADVHRRRRLLQVEEGHVERAQPVGHDDAPPRPPPRTRSVRRLRGPLIVTRESGTQHRPSTGGSVVHRSARRPCGPIRKGLRRTHACHRSDTPSSRSSSSTVDAASECRTATIPAAVAARMFGGRSSTKTIDPAGRPSRSAASA